MTNGTGVDETDNYNEALSLYTGPRRTYEIFCIVAEGPKSMQQILEAVPGEETFVGSIVQGLVDDNLIIITSTKDELYELSPHGRQIKETLDKIPADVKAQAYLEAWGSRPPDGY